jgi:hypothetical protein
MINNTGHRYPNARRLGCISAPEWVILFGETDIKNLYTLGFGDLIDNNKVDYYSVSDNQDTDKILATVADSIVLFLEKHLKAQVIASGSTDSRTRLYQFKISKVLELLVDHYEIKGQSNDVWEDYEKNRNYSAFSINNK